MSLLLCVLPKRISDHLEDLCPAAPSDVRAGGEGPEGSVEDLGGQRQELCGAQLTQQWPQRQHLLIGQVRHVLTLGERVSAG